MLTWLWKLLLRITNTRLLQSDLNIMPLDIRQSLILDALRSLNSGLSVEDRFRLNQELYKQRGMYRASMLSSSDYARAYGFFDLIKGINNVDGDIVECGVGHGKSLAYIVYALAYHNIPKSIHAFDSFEGFPDAVVQDLGHRVTEANKIPAGWTDTSVEMIKLIFEAELQQDKSLLAQYNPPLAIHKGFFSDTLSKHLPEKIALLHADSDLYTSTRDILVNCLPKMTVGSIIIFDEYDDARWPGVKQAVDEMINKRHTIQYFNNVRRYGIVIN